MNENHVTWFETAQSLALFYPKLAVAMGAMAIKNSMMPFNRPLIKDPAFTAVGAASAPASKRRSASRKSSKRAVRKTSKRAHGRGKAA